MWTICGDKIYLLIKERVVSVRSWPALRCRHNNMLMMHGKRMTNETFTNANYASQFLLFHASHTLHYIFTTSQNMTTTIWIKILHLHCQIDSTTMNLFRVKVIECGTIIITLLSLQFIVTILSTFYYVILNYLTKSLNDWWKLLYGNY